MPFKKSSKKSSGLLLKESALRKRYPDSGLASVISVTPDNTIYLPSRILALNHQLGGGLPYGKIIEGFGEESTGKSLLAMDFAVITQQLGGIVLWDDAECSWNNAWAKRNGIDLSKVELLKDENILETISDWIADMVVYYRSILKNNEPILLVGDSIASWETKLNMETADSQSGEDMGRRAKMIYKMLRKRRKILSKYGVCTFFINQVRKKPVSNKWEDPDTTPGGMAMRFYADIRLGIHRGKAVKNRDDHKVGQEVYFRIKKNKIGPPKENIKGKVFFKKHNGNLGYDKYTSLPEALIEDRVLIKKRGPRYYFKGELLAHGDLNLLKKLKDDSDLRSKLIKESSINTFSKTKAKIDALTKNLYPVKMKAKNDKKDEE